MISFTFTKATASIFEIVFWRTNPVSSLRKICTLFAPKFWVAWKKHGLGQIRNDLTWMSASASFFCQSPSGAVKTSFSIHRFDFTNGVFVFGGSKLKFNIVIFSGAWILSFDSFTNFLNFSDLQFSIKFQKPLFDRRSKCKSWKSSFFWRWRCREWGGRIARSCR